jgi:hypothetical protein
MPRQLENLTLEFLDWIARRPRTYADAMEAWRTSCPRLTVWEDALAAGLIRVEHGQTRSESLIALTPVGRAALDARESPA